MVSNKMNQGFHSFGLVFLERLLLRNPTDSSPTELPLSLLLEHGSTLRRLRCRIPLVDGWGL